FGGALDNEGSSLALTNCLLAYNDAYTGGAVANSGGGTLQLVNCTVAANTGYGSGKGIAQVRGPAAIHNTIFLGNSDSEKALGDIEQSQIDKIGGTLAIDYSIIQGLNAYAGNSNVAYDPLFQDSISFIPNPLYSPAVDAGANSYVSGITTDLAGIARIYFSS